MSRALFLDTSGWFAALSPRDQYHARAAPHYRKLLQSGRTPLVTTNLVVAEMHALLARRAGDEVGVRFLDRLHADAAHVVLWVTRALERGAVDRWLRPFAGRGFSLTDAVSFEVMRSEEIASAFTFDHHFSDAGFALVPV